MEDISIADDLDRIDIAIMHQLQEDGRITNSELARRVNLSQPATHTRVKRLEGAGLIRGHVALLDRDKLGLDLVCLIQIRLRAHSEKVVLEFQRLVGEMPEVLECFHMTGPFDYLLKVVFENRRGLEEFLRTRLVHQQEISQISTSVVLSEIKSTTVLPLPDNR